MTYKSPTETTHLTSFEREDVTNEVAQAIAASGLVVGDMNFCRDLAEVALIAVSRIIERRKEMRVHAN